MRDSTNDRTLFRQGWAEADITPLQPVLIAGQFSARLSEGIRDPLTATAWAVQSGNEHVVFVSCDLIAIPEEMRDAVRLAVGRRQLAGLDPERIILNATHTHTAPEIRLLSALAPLEGAGITIDEAMTVQSYVDFAVDRIAEAVSRAWSSCAPGAVAYGWGNAVIGRNRRWVDDEGNATMYNLKSSPDSRFRHIEGYEDHSLNVIATYDQDGNMTGLVVNVPCPSQITEHLFVISADWWHETRLKLRSLYGEGLYVLPQCSAAGDLSPHQLLDRDAHERMLQLKGRTAREEIAVQLVSAVEDIVPYIRDTRDSNPVIKAQSIQLDLPANILTEQQVDAARLEAERWMGMYEQEKRKLEEQPELRSKPRWYEAVSVAFRRSNWHMNVVRRYEYQKTCGTLPVELQAVRLGDVALAAVPFELYLDYGNQMKVRSIAKQTFLVQLAGTGAYLPSVRSVIGGGYGSVPASNPIAPVSGQIVADWITEQIVKLMGN